MSTPFQQPAGFVLYLYRVAGNEQDPRHKSAVWGLGSVE